MEIESTSREYKNTYRVNLSRNPKYLATRKDERKSRARRVDDSISKDEPARGHANEKSIS